MINEISKKRKLVGYWILGILIFSIFCVLAFEIVTGRTRSSNHNLTPSQKQERQALERQLHSKLLEEKKKEEISLYMPCQQLPSCLSGIRTVLFRKIIQKEKSLVEINIDQIRKYDFSFPQSSEYKNDKDWSVFYDYSSPDFFNKLEYIISDLSDSKKIIFTISNRVNGKGSNQPELLAILPNFKKSACEKITKETMGKIKIPELEHIPNLQPHPTIMPLAKIVTFPENPSSYGCVQFLNRFYYYQIIYEF